MSQESQETSPTHQDMILSFVVVGLVIILLSLLYLTRSTNKYVRFYTWTLTKMGVDIFLAVNLFFEISDETRRVLTGSKRVNFENTWIADILVIILVEASMHCVLFYAARRRGPAVGDMQQPRELVSSLTWAGFCAHLAAFSWLHFWTQLQAFIAAQNRFHTLKALNALVIVFFAAVANLCRCRVGRYIRDKFGSRLERHSQNAWQKQESEASIEAGSVQIAYLMLHAVRYSFVFESGKSMRFHGLVETSGVECLFLEVMTVLVLGVLSHLLMLLIFALFQDSKANSAGEDEPSEADSYDYEFHWRGALYEMITKSLTFFTGWAFLLAMQLTVEYFDNGELHGKPDLHAQIHVAVNSTLFAFATITVLGRLTALLMGTGRFRRGVALMTIIQSLSLMVGFSWEQVFDAATEDLAWKQSHVLDSFLDLSFSSIFYRDVCELLMGALLLVFTMPAVFNFISPAVLTSEEELAEHHAHLVRMGMQNRDKRDLSLTELEPLRSFQENSNGDDGRSDPGSSSSSEDACLTYPCI